MTSVAALSSLAPNVNLAGIYLARTVGANRDLLDVARIEVLKGPQGSLFGRTTIGGAIPIVTAIPAGTWSGMTVR